MKIILTSLIILALLCLASTPVEDPNVKQLKLKVIKLCERVEFLEGVVKDKLNINIPNKFIQHRCEE
jgi:hypothetical protein